MLLTTTLDLALRLTILILEGIPPELRKANALIWWGIWKPVIWPLLDETTKKAIDETLS